ncbi:hypothetical protein BH20ACT4_BH20ACT4_02000 [soil metagenome]
MTEASEPGRDMRDRALAATALFLYSLMVAVGFSRVFSGWEFLADLVPIIVVGHLAGLAMARFHLAITFVVQLAVVAWVVGLVGYGYTYRFGLPTSETIEIMRADISFAGEQFPDAVAPVVYAGGWTALATLGIGIAVLLADLFAFRAAARFEALVPGGVLFVVVGALGSGRDRVMTTAGLILAAVLTVGALRSMQQRSARIVIGKRAPRRLRMVAGALAVGSVTALVAGVVGPRLPGSASDAVWDTSRGGTDVTRIESPLVDIRSRLVDQSTSEMFRVRANAESYWRVATLPSFDGARWKLDRSNLSPADEMARQGPSNRLVITQEIEISGGLRGQLVPAAPEPVEADGTDLRWSARNSTLLVADPDGLQRGDVISVASSAPRYFPGQLDRATASNPPGSIDYLALPDGLPDSVIDLAGEVTAGATTPYQRALALQDWFRSEFEYSLEVQSGHGNNAIEAFLRLRVGYCEQFAGSFAAMARSVGLPARVAVGYTPGTYLEDSDTYSVAGRNAHAWPEVWFDDLGWVAFEPTPGRGAPGNEPYTGVEAEQDLGEGPPEPVPPGQGGGGGGPAPTTTTQAPPSSGQTPGGNQPEEVPDLDGAGGATQVSTPGGGQPSRDLSRAATPTLIVLLIIGAVALAPAVIRRVRKQHLGADPAAAIVGIYSRLQGLAAAAGAPISAAATPNEFSKRAAQAVPGVRNDFTKLTDAVTAGAFGPSDAIDERTVELCEKWYANIEEVAKSLLPWHVRLRRYLTLQ